MDLDDIRKLYVTTRLDMRDALRNRISDPLVVDGKWYWAENEEDRVHERLRVKRPQINSFLELHGSLIGQFDSIERFAQDKVYPLMLGATQDLMRILEKYHTLIRDHRREYHQDAFLAYPSNQGINPNGSDQGFLKEIIFLDGLTMRLMEMYEMQAKFPDIMRLQDCDFPDIKTMEQPYDQTADIDPLDSSYSGRLRFVHNEVTTKFLG